MSEQNFFQRYYQQLSQLGLSACPRRLLLRAMITGTVTLSSFASIALADEPADLRGGISILVHEFAEKTATETTPTATAESAEKVSEEIAIVESDQDDAVTEEVADVEAGDLAETVIESVASEESANIDEDIAIVESDQVAPTNIDEGITEAPATEAVADIEASDSAEAVADSVATEEPANVNEDIAVVESDQDDAADINDAIAEDAATEDLVDVEACDATETVVESIVADELATQEDTGIPLEADASELDPFELGPEDIACPPPQHILDAYAAVGTHDSVPVQGPSEPEATTEVAVSEEADEKAADLEANPKSDSSDQFNQAVASAVVLSASKVGIQLEQLIEPFAMVGESNQDAPVADTAQTDEPTQQQLAEAVALNRWWLDDEPNPSEQAEDAAEPVAIEVAQSEASANAEEIADVETIVEAPAVELVAEEPVTDDELFDEIVQLAQQEPLDVQAESVCPAETEVVDVETEASDNEAIEIASTEVPATDAPTPQDNEEPSDLIGSAAMIVTVEEAYLPYDLAARDLKLDALALSTIEPIAPQNYVTATKPAAPADPTTAQISDAQISDVEPSDDQVAIAPSDMPEESASDEAVSLALPEEPQQPEFAEVADEAPVESAEATTVQIAKHASPECLLDELIYDASEIADEYHLRDLTFARIGESVGDFFAAIAPAPAKPQVPVMQIAGEVIPAPVADPLPNAEPEQLEPPSAEQQLADLPESAPAIEAVAAAELPTMEVDGEQIPAPVADPLPNAEASTSQVATADEATEPVEVTQSVSQIDVQAVVDVEAADQSPANLAWLAESVTQWQRDVIADVFAKIEVAVAEPVSEPATTDAAEAADVQVAQQPEQDSESVTR